MREREDDEHRGAPRQPARREAARRDPLGEASRDRGRRDHGDGHRRERGAGGRDAEPEPALQEERRREQHAEEDDVRAQRPEDAGAHRAVPEHLQSQEGSARTTLVQRERDREGDRGEDQGGEHAPVHGGAADGREREERHRDGRHEEAQSAHVEARRALQVRAAWEEEPAKPERERARGHVHQEQQPPASEREQQPADHGAGGEAERLRGALRAERATEALLGRGERDDRHAVRLEHRRADALQHAARDERIDRRRERAQRRARDEHHEAVEVDDLRPTRSESRPNAATVETSATRYASPTHATTVTLSWKSRSMVGSATVTMLASSCPMTAPMQTVATARRQAPPWARTQAGRAGSVARPCHEPRMVVMPPRWPGPIKKSKKP